MRRTRPFSQAQKPKNVQSRAKRRKAHLNLGGYGITKAGIHMIAKNIALEVGKYGITANAISPGATITERTLEDDPHSEHKINHNGKYTHLHRKHPAKCP
ncbi:SDR family oxidoreductase [Dictyobacter arantiisoli]|uniref:SDR family oxidoreductase n=1 Tax=Dictyobacter arantiisoli TaxID=2014874 RepID=A0A5A5TED5_9CHLR|nr:SDR family oxidoreductase [Dictyobacter arantiisoli]GCF09443.1 hypothetical protein KDI_30070 [Dictyobacter arantiisoli]